EFHPILAEYGDLWDEYAGVLDELGRAGQERSAHAAADLWNQA
ncbi:MAG: hypothetical protein H6Q11_741, partial [Acidobacteria bacterium]|nr:hypothetical protein [Acidobacteriota bacterium]